MRNLKRVLALAVVFALSLTLFAGAAFTDSADIGENYADDVNMLVQLKVIGGYPDGSFKPQGNITRAEFAKMAYVLKYGADDSGSLFASQRSQFTDVEGNDNVKWAKGYINYCANQGIVGGIGNNKFNPNGNITVAEVSKMLLVILGCDAEKEGFGGPNWISNVTAKAMALGVFNGWTGNPTEPATRELVAKLMRNTIFAPVYLYSPITGIGSQVNLLDPSVKNETLGERTMGLKHVTGIVVANENYSIGTDEEGDPLVGNAPATREGYSTVYYEYTTSGSNAITSKAYLTIDRALDDALLGNLVDVYFTADGTEGTYSNVKVIGDVLVNAKTRVYEVYAPDVTIFPDGKSQSRTEVKPYISFKVDGVERKIEPRDSSIPKVRPVDYYDPSRPTKYNGDGFQDMSYVDATSTYSDLQRDSLEHPGLGSKFFTEMGEDSLTMYRFVSVDGGSSYSYIFNFHIHDRAFGYVDVIQKHESGTISLSGGIGTLDADEYVLIGEVEKGDKVIVFNKSGKLQVAKVDIISGAATAVNADGVVINGETYRIDTSIFTNNVPGYETLSAYYAQNKGASKESTRYWVYNKFILDIDATAEVGMASDYAVVLSSSYDKIMQTARVKLAFANGTEGSFEVAKFYTDRYDEYSEESDRPADFAGNQKVGWIYKYSMVDGRVDLSAEQGYEPQGTIGNSGSGGKSKVSGGKFIVNYDMGSGARSYTATDRSTLFLLYADYDNNEVNKQFPMKAKVYKLNDVGDFSSSVITSVPYETIVDSGMTDQFADMEFFNVVEDDKSGVRSLSVAAMTVGKKIPNMTTRDTDDLAYVVSMRQLYRVETDKYYVSAKLITEDGLIELESIDEPADASGETKWFKQDNNAGKEVPNFSRGTVIRFKTNADGKLTTIDNTNGRPEDMARAIPTDTTPSGLYYITAMQLGNGILAYFPYGEVVELDGGKLPPAETLPLDDEYDIITISDDRYVGNYLATWSRNMEIGATDYNAIVQFSSGKVIRIFSFEQF